MEDFYTQNLGIEKRHDPVKDLSYQDVLDRVYGDENSDKNRGESDDEDEWDDSVESDDDLHVGNQREMQNLIEFRNRKDEYVVINWTDVLKVLDSQNLPKIPKKKEVEQINPRPYAIPRVLFGKKMPKPEEEGDKKGAKKAAPKKQDKNAEPPIVYKWKDGPPLYTKGTVHYMADAR